MSSGFKEYKSICRTVGGNEGAKCKYNTRLDVYGCGCSHDCKYCYAKSLLSFRGLWDADAPRVANLKKVETAIAKLKKHTIVRLGGMTDCFQPLEEKKRITLETIKLLNAYDIGYLIVTKSHLVANDEYLAVFNKRLAHIQISVTCLDDVIAGDYERASPPSKRLKAIYDLHRAGLDVALRLSPLMEEYIDFDMLNSLSISKCLVEFLRVNSTIKKWFPAVDYTKYTVKHSNYYHLPLAEKIRILQKIKFGNISICEDVTEHYDYWKKHYNPNSDDCCNLGFMA
ncbi:MAG: 4Fe-4S cluster-binding domain-containing protein [Defluviitaleaceae bacterium]|nr:4Fe-4S cluster-binding domain-containing protein [Defluviitaleaceae bacterium]